MSPARNGERNGPDRRSLGRTGPYRELARLSGASFDREYLSLMSQEHQHEVQLFQEAARNSTDPEVRAFASQYVGELQAHLDQVNNLSKSVAE